MIRVTVLCVTLLLSGCGDGDGRGNGEVEAWLAAMEPETRRDNLLKRGKRWAHVDGLTAADTASRRTLWERYALALNKARETVRELEAAEAAEHKAALQRVKWERQARSMGVQLDPVEYREAAFAEWKAREAAEAAEMEVAALERVLNEAIRRSAENLEADK